MQAGNSGHAEGACVQKTWQDVHIFEEVEEVEE